jgi:hypothetical protein
MDAYCDVFTGRISATQQVSSTSITFALVAATAAAEATGIDIVNNSDPPQVLSSSTSNNGSKKKDTLEKTRTTSSQGDHDSSPKMHKGQNKKGNKNLTPETLTAEILARKSFFLLLYSLESDTTDYLHEMFVELADYISIYMDDVK